MGVQTGDIVGVYYDPMLAKVIAYGEHRDGAIRRLDHALSQLQLLGLRNNIAFLRRVPTYPDHVAGKITTAFIEQHPELLNDAAPPPPAALIAAAILKSGQSCSAPAQTPEAMRQHWRNNAYRPMRQTFKHSGMDYEVSLSPEGDGAYNAKIGEVIYDVRIWTCTGGNLSLSVDGHRRHLTVIEGEENRWWIYSLSGTYDLQWITPLPEGGQAKTAEGSLHAPMPGQIRGFMSKLGSRYRWAMY